jgi:hypothetical protein
MSDIADIKADVDAHLWIFQWIGILEYIPCYCAPAEHWGPLPVIRQTNRKILIEQNIKRRTGPALYYMYNLLGRDEVGYPVTPR